VRDHGNRQGRARPQDLVDLERHLAACERTQGGDEVGAEAIVDVEQ
jgi:hypothetical protein